MNQTSRVDMHVHSSASQLSKLGVQRSLQIPECATAPEEVYALAKRRGMDFVTITDHDTIAGIGRINDLPDTFVSEELTAWFEGEPQAVHVLCYGITPDDHGWLQEHSGDVESCAEYLHSNEITTALAHPFYAVEAPLTTRHRRLLAKLFPIWETRNGSRAKELNLPAFVYTETHGGTAIGGSDDHAGIDVGRTFTETPAAQTPEQFLAHIRAGRAQAHGLQGSAAKWAHAAMALAVRSLSDRTAPATPDPTTVLRIVDRVLREGNARNGIIRADLGPEDALALLSQWLVAMGLELDSTNLLAALQEGELSHPDLYRRARRIHERKLARAAAEIVAMADGLDLNIHGAVQTVFGACIPAIPYATAGAFLGREKTKLTRAEGDRPRVALVADGIGAVHGVTHTIAQVRDRGVPGFDVEVIGTDSDVDRRLSAVAELEFSFYPGLRIGVPSLLAVVDALAEGGYDLVHLCAPGPLGLCTWLLARMLELPVVGSYHTELAAYAQLRTADARLEFLADAALRGLYGACDLVLSPSRASDRRLAELGIAPAQTARWDRGVDVSRFNPALSEPSLLPGEVSVLYAGRLSREKGVDLLAEAFLNARERDPRLHLVLAGGGPEEGELRSRLGGCATFLGWLDGEDLARAYASADVFLFASHTDTFGQVILEAQASGLPVVAIDQGGPASLIEDGKTGLLAPADPGALAEAVISLVSSPSRRERLRRAGLEAVRGRHWDASLEQLAAGYRRALDARAARKARTAA